MTPSDGTPLGDALEGLIATAQAAADRQERESLVTSVESLRRVADGLATALGATTAAIRDGHQLDEDALDAMSALLLGWDDYRAAVDRLLAAVQKPE